MDTRLARRWPALALAAAMLALLPASATADRHAIAYVPDRGPYALLGDGQALGASLAGAASSYPNYGGANNYVGFYRAGYGTYFDLMVDWRGQPGRFLRLELRTPRSISYTCVTGPEDPANPSGPPLGAAIDASAPYGANAIQCYNATRDDGYYVYFSNDCFSILRAADPPARYVIEGLRCKGKVADRDGEKIRWLTANGTTRNYADPEALIFDVPIYIEAFITRYGY